MPVESGPSQFPDDFLGENIGIAEVVGFLQGLSLSQKISRLALSRLMNELQFLAVHMRKTSL